MPSVELDLKHWVKVVPSEGATQTVKALGAACYYANTPNPPELGSEGTEVAEGGTVTLELPSGKWFIAKAVGCILEREPAVVESTGTSQLAKESVTAAKIATGAVTETKLGAEAVTEGKIKALAVTAGKLAAEAVETAKIKLLAVTAGTLAAEAVETGKIKLLAVTEGTIAEAVQRKLLGTTAAEAVKTQTEAEGVTGIEPSATKAALVTVSILGKAEATAFNVEANAVVVAEQKSTPAAGDIIVLGTFLVQPGKKIKVAKVTGAVTNVKFSVQLMN